MARHQRYYQAARTLGSGPVIRAGEVIATIQALASDIEDDGMGPPDHFVVKGKKVDFADLTAAGIGKQLAKFGVTKVIVKTGVDDSRDGVPDGTYPVQKYLSLQKQFD
jgi:hypothetical protein